MPRKLRGGWLDITDCNIELTTKSDHENIKYYLRTGESIVLKVNGKPAHVYGIYEMIWDMTKWKDIKERGKIKVKVDEKFAKEEIKAAEGEPNQKLHFIGYGIEIISDNTPENTEIFTIASDGKMYLRTKPLGIRGFKLFIGDVETINTVELIIS